MIVLEFVYGTLLLSLCCISTISDLKYGLIYNKVLLFFVIAGGALDIVFFGLFARELTRIYLINVLCVAIIALIIFYTNTFAGGDTKLIIVLAMLYPVDFYVSYHDSRITLLFSVGFAIFYGYIYLLIDSLRNIFNRTNKIEKEYVKKTIISFIKNYTVVTIYVCCINIFNSFLGKFFIELPVWVVWSLCFITAWLVAKNRILKKWQVFVPVLLLEIVMGIILKIIPLSINPKSYFMVMVLLICQITIKTNLYKTISLSELKKGMILSTVTSLLMQNTKIQGMPRISAEDLRSRLSEKEVQSIIKWGKSRKISTVTVVKKIPFAMFIALGYISYFVLWRILAWD